MGKGGRRGVGSKAVTLMAEVGRIKYGEIYGKRQFMTRGKKITV